MDDRKDAERRSSPREGGNGRRQPPGAGTSSRVRARARQQPASMQEHLPEVPGPAASRPPTSRQPRPVGNLRTARAGEPEPESRRAREPEPRAAKLAAATRAEEEQRQAIERFRPFIRVAAVSVSPRPTSPDYFGLRRHTATSIPREDASCEMTHQHN